MWQAIARIKTIDLLYTVVGTMSRAVFEHFEPRGNTFFRPQKVIS